MHRSSSSAEVVITDDSEAGVETRRLQGFEMEGWGIHVTYLQMYLL